ncbi:hypothetical protein Natpe_4381 (plasmid) [Natrinema pellirubrum DSM 15624]|uniref:Uncharacterized protein n=1 Tax=Natrinema pellirubrum (strain DSM 15624 / CIP 106293 / JCM 10476 / NCIMB 786 / 157) TaxID=797303 RepID=L0JRC2_NATP1|nr:hypothetical protein [Natrinema pellirubrum]AGB34075.1 hypothetical protein Natpe_4381 [Natrinema pellirubrum DSM 15624]
MVVVEEVTKLSERRTQTSSEAFPDDALASIRAAVEAVPASIFDGSTKHTKVGGFDATISDGLSQYEGDAAGGYNPNCKLWSHQGFHYSVDLYDADACIAIEVEKSERKNVSDDLLKFQKGYRTQKDGRPKIEFGCLVVLVNYLDRHNLYQHSLTKLDFMKGVLFIDDIAVIGYRDPRPD